MFTLGFYEELKFFVFTQNSKLVTGIGKDMDSIHQFLDFLLLHQAMDFYEAVHFLSQSDNAGDIADDIIDWISQQINSPFTSSACQSKICLCLFMYIISRTQPASLC